MEKSNNLNLDANKNYKDEFGDNIYRQLIITGCPGVGKSYFIKKISDTLNEEQISRITFHSELSYGDFVGAYKPVSAYVSSGTEVYDSNFEPISINVSGKDKTVSPIVRYEFKPGPFVDLYIKALKNPEKDFLLIIEEINRANPSIVFGDIIHLLDRNYEGESLYNIKISNDLKSYLREKLKGDVEDSKFETLKLPKNLFIWGTMNRADESINYIDSAFLRRWVIHYIPYTKKSEYDNKEIVEINRQKITWKRFREIINNEISKIDGIEDDKFIGPYFLSEMELKDFRIIFSKLISYLWYDVVSMERDSLFIKGSFSQLYEKWNKKENIFNANISWLEK